VFLLTSARAGEESSADGADVGVGADVGAGAADVGDVVLSDLLPLVSRGVGCRLCLD